MVAKYTKKKNQPTAPASQPTPPPKNSPLPITFVEVNVVQFAESSDGKNKGKNKLKNPTIKRKVIDHKILMPIPKIRER